MCFESFSNWIIFRFWTYTTVCVCVHFLSSFGTCMITTCPREILLKEKKNHERTLFCSVSDPVGRLTGILYLTTFSVGIWFFFFLLLLFGLKYSYWFCIFIEYLYCPFLEAVQFWKYSGHFDFLSHLNILKFRGFLLFSSIIYIYGYNSLVFSRSLRFLT